MVGKYTEPTSLTDTVILSLKNSGKFRLDLSDVKTMTLSGNLTGDAQASYAPNPAIQPAQSINFRDLIPTVRSESGLYVYYRENSGLTNNISAQTEGSDKGENNYSLTEVKVVNDYLAGFSTFSKQMLKSLPFMTQTLPRMLQRDFFKAENAALSLHICTLMAIPSNISGSIIVASLF